MDRDLAMARKIARAVAEAGGRAYFVGGYVRDRLLGQENKDIDMEVHRVPVDALERILDSLGERLTMGVSFGVMGLRHYGLDIAMPRSETATGRGHKDFAVFVDPFLGEEKAASRRDFTINAMMEDVLTGEILDPFGGRDDLSRGVIRHVCDRSFTEDPLRVLRAAQFAARFGFTVAEVRKLRGRGLRQQLHCRITNTQPRGGGESAPERTEHENLGLPQRKNARRTGQTGRCTDRGTAHREL